MDELDGVEFIQGDFTEDEVLKKIMDCVENENGRPCNFRYGPKLKWYTSC